MRPAFDSTSYRRSTLGFDRLFYLLDSGLRDEDGYPPFDIVKEGEESYRIGLAVAGVCPHHIELVGQQNRLTIIGKRAGDGNDHNYVHRGIVTRPFEQRFQLADFIEAGEARFEIGLLSSAVRRVAPEAMKPAQGGIRAAANDRIEAPKGDSQRAA